MKARLTGRDAPAHPRWAATPWALGVVLLFTLATTLVNIAARTASASSASGDRSRISQIQHQIVDQGIRVQQLVARAGQVQAREDAITARLAIVGRQLTADESAVGGLAAQVRQLAINAYVDAGSAGELALLAAPSTSTDLASVYANIAAGRFDTVMTSYQLDQHRIQVDRTVLRDERVAALTTLAQLQSAKQAAQFAVARDESLLTGVQGNLHALLVAEAAQQAAAQAAQERALARQQAERQAAAARAAARSRVVEAPLVATSVPTTTTPTSTTSPAPPQAPAAGATSAYANPLRAVGGLVPERIDQGVDYRGFGPIYAVGDGVVLSTYNGGWPGGTFITYRLTSGPAAGLVVYAAEDISPTVQVGESVNADTVIGTVYEGPDGIETGWAEGGLGDTMAAVSGQFGGGNSTAFGANFSAMLSSLGAPGGVLQNDPPSGALPLGWPTW